MNVEYFCCTYLCKSVYQHYLTSLVETLLLITVLLRSLDQMLASGLRDSDTVKNSQAKFHLPEDNQLKSIP